MRDGVNIARAGIPSISLVTEDFWNQGDFVAASVGMTSVPRLKLPHPVAGTGEARITEVADGIVDEILEKFAHA